MENFIVSARKYRPDNFKSVVGQASITATLKNAIKNNQLGHAYLFSGPRGVGKTTCARIFAKTINCQNLGENMEACNECESCKSFNENRAYNIHELDAASNNSVDDIRSLTEQVRIPPQVGTYSLYIIDEVHMLSAQAFNAFLKTLEEPPSHAIFILATTEKHKIIPTILSRCQIYDFNRIRIEDTVEYLKYIAGEERINYEEEALHVIAQKAEGAMRDALSIFDQVVVFSNNDISYQQVIENLNILHLDYYFKLVDLFLNTKVPDVLLILDEILKKGFDERNFVNGLASHLRNLMVAKNPETLVLLDVGQAFKDKYQQQSTAVPLEFLYESLNICSETDVQFRNSKNQRLTIELALVKLANLTQVQKKKIAESKTDKAQQTPQIQAKNSQQQASRTHTEARTPTINNHQLTTTQVANPESEKPVVSDSSQTTENKRQVRGNPHVHAKSISIKGVLKGERRNVPLAEEEIGEQDQISKITPVDPGDVQINEDDLRAAWTAFAEKNKNNVRAYNALISCKPSLGSDGKIKLEVATDAQKEYFTLKVKPGIAAYLQEKYANIEYLFDIRIAAAELQPKRAYTDEDKLQLLMQKNPDLERMKEIFKLDFDT